MSFLVLGRDWRKIRDLAGAIAWFASCSTGICGSDATTRTMPPVSATAPLTIGGEQLLLPYSVQWSVRAIEAGRRRVTAIVSTPLDPLLPYIRRELVGHRRDNCARRGENWVVEPPRLSLGLQGERLQLAVDTNVELWVCESLFGSEVKTRLLDGPVAIEIFVIWRASANRADLSVDVGRVKVRGSLGDAARIFAMATGEDLAESLRTELQAVSMASLPLPQKLLELGAVVEDARFTVVDGEHNAEVELSADVRPEELLPLLPRFLSLPAFALAGPKPTPRSPRLACFAQTPADFNCQSLRGAENGRRERSKTAA